MIGLFMLLFGSLSFAALTYNLLSRGPLLFWDKTLANTLPAMALKGPLFLKSLIDSGFYIGKEVIIAIGLILGLYFLYKRFWLELAMLTIGLVGASTLFLLLSNYFGRLRPPTQIWIIENIPGFPSGHAVSAVTFYGLLAYLLVPKIRPVFWKYVVAAAALLIIFFIGFTRVFTGGHYLTDVLAGYSVGIAWSGFVYTLLELAFQKRRSPIVKV
ncbi:MAG: phosphatase PAP2 family protein [Anaerolineaceae bacterium]|nr:phosphatase PAP2 family protein [Anaerolineaceae bacterium]